MNSKIYELYKKEIFVNPEELNKLKKYINEETVEVSDLAKILRVTYTTARNYLFRFLSEELGKKDLPNFYKYKR